MTLRHATSLVIATLLSGTALPVFAQDICGGSGAGGQWIGGNEADSDIATADSYREQMALVLGGNDYVSLFSLSAPTEVRIEAEGRGAGDPLIDLIDSTGAIILSDDDSGGNGAARGEVMLDPGTYCMSMQSYDGAPMTAFVRIGRIEQEPLTDGIDEAVLENDNTTTGSGSCATAIPLGDSAAIQAGVSNTGSVDANGFWSFTLTEDMALSLRAENEDADPVLTLYDAEETYIDENDDYDGLNSRLDVVSPLPAGDYCIGVTALNDTSLPITVSISVYDPAAALAELYDRGEAAPPIGGAVQITDLGVLETRLRQDVQISAATTWYSLDVPEAGLMVIEAIAAGDDADPWVIVYDDLGREIVQNDDYVDWNSFVAARVAAGTYLVGVKDINESSGFVRLSFERFVAAE